MLNGKGRLGLATLACVGLAIAISNTPAAAWKRGAVKPLRCHKARQRSKVSRSICNGNV